MKTIFVLSLFIPLVALAQSMPSGDLSLDGPDVAPPTVSKTPVTGTNSNSAGSNRKKQTVDFEDELIQGEVNKPELFYLLQQKQFNFKRLIKLREDFLPEMRRTSEEIKRGGGSN